MFPLKNKIYTAFLCFSLSLASWAQETHTNYNFETFEDSKPVGWLVNSESTFLSSQDFETVIEGKSSLRVEIEKSEKVNSMTSISRILPNYNGKKLVLSGYIKTKTKGLLEVTPVIRVDPMLDFVQLPQLISGTTEWQKYEVEVTLKPEHAQQIIVAIYVMGQGTLWLDDFKVTIDGEDIDKAEVLEITYPAKADKTFDQGSAVVFPSLKANNIQDLALLGRVWGFLKYHHPVIAKGEYNWDYELFRFLSDYLKVGSKTERDALLLQWIAQLGTVEPCETCQESSPKALLKPNLDWMKTYSLSTELQHKINYLYKNRTQGNNYYVSGAPSVGNAVFTNEANYEDMEYPDAGFRLLALYRFWNVMQYYMPNRHLTDKNWEEVLALHIQPFIDAQDRLAYEKAALLLIAEVNDTHSDLWQGGKELAQYRGNRYAPFRVEFIEDQLVVTDIYNPELLEGIQIEPGDRLTHINHKSIVQILDSISPYYPASNRSAQLRDIGLFNILRTNKSNVHIAYVDKSDQNQVAMINMYPKSELNSYGWFKPRKGEPSYHFLEDSIGYVTLGNIQNSDAQKIKEAFKSTKGIVIDIRNYPSAFMPFALGSFFVSQPTPFVKFTQPNYNNPGEIVFNDPLIIEPDGAPYQGKVVVLVDERTQSTAEYTTMAFRAGDRVTVLGSQTAGADGNVSPISLPGGLGTMISGLGVYYPNGEQTQRIGIVPDVMVNRSIQGVREGRDELVEKAIALIKE